jgi:hypothetical protein
MTAGHNPSPVSAGSQASEALTRRDPALLLALALAFVYHGGLLISGTFKRTYDAYVHIFFADHYARAWFDHWDYRWYTGFTMTSYPPGSQQSIALLSPVFGLLTGFVIVQLFAVLLVTLGTYRSAMIWVSREAAGYAALVAVFASSISETVHVFGQLPTMFSLGFLLNALPFVYRWVDRGRQHDLLAAWALTAATTAGHHVTTLFGAIFFVGPVLALGIVEKFRQPLPDEPAGRPPRVTRANLRPLVVRRVRRILPAVLRAGVFGAGMIVLLVLVVLPYWLWSRADPITQVSIPHASRDSFIANPNAGLVFWLIPYGIGLITLPYAFYKGLTTRAWPLALSLGLAFFLGTGGTTPLPKLLLRGAYEILTLDRFTFWATILVLPLQGEFVASLRHRNLARYVREQFGDFALRTVQVSLLVGVLAVSVFTVNLTQFRRFQPPAIDPRPIVNFLEKDQHWRWRYLTLGFGDQVAWLSAQTTATSVDGNYHSARRLPELTTTPVERLEGAKFRGIPGIGSLQQFLAVPDKYNLKYIFSADQFYDPLLYFSGWHRVQRLENGVMVWEREDIPPLPEVLPRREIPHYQRAMWGILPMTAIGLGLLTLAVSTFRERLPAALRRISPGRWRIVRPWLDRLRRVAERLDLVLLRWSCLPDADHSPAVVWQVWIEWARRLPRPAPAPPTARQLRTAALIITVLVGAAFAGRWYLKQARDPLAVVLAYYDDLDFRRFGDAYARLDPRTRPSYDQYRLDLSVSNGLVASYGKLDSVRPAIIGTETDRLVVDVRTNWVTALAAYPTVQRLILERNPADGRWYIEPPLADVVIPPDQFFRRPAVAWGSQGRRRVTAETTAFTDVQDRPELQILSARLVETTITPVATTEELLLQKNGPASQRRYSVVGELINTDVDPADVTLAAYLYDDQGQVLTWYNAQLVMAHKILPKEVTPFRVDFEGVAGAALGDLTTAGDFRPGAYSPITLSQRIAAFEVYAKAVVTGRDLYREVAAQDVAVRTGGDRKPQVEGTLINAGIYEATIPHVLVTYYDAAGRVAWVDHLFGENAIRPQRAQPFAVPITPSTAVRVVLDRGDMFANILQSAVRYDPAWRERIALPPEIGYAALRVSVHSYLAGAE